MPETLKLKKYANNRRLYDPEKSAYVTLSEVAQAIKSGRRVEVIDAKTREDVTAAILTQIVLEEARHKNALLPVPLLHLVIRYGDTLLVEFFEKYLQHTLEVYLSQKKLLDDQFKKWLEMQMGFGKTAQPLNPFHTLFQGLSKNDADDPKDKDPGR